MSRPLLQPPAFTLPQQNRPDPKTLATKTAKQNNQLRYDKSGCWQQHQATIPNTWMGYDCWGRSFGRIGSAADGLRVGWLETVGIPLPIRGTKGTASGWNSLFGWCNTNEARPVTGFFPCFFFGEYQRLGEKNSIFACLVNHLFSIFIIYPWTVEFTTTGISSTEISSSPGCWMQDLDYNGVSAVAWAEKCGRVSGGHKVKNRENCGIEVCEVWYYGICFSFFSPKKMLLKKKQQKFRGSGPRGCGQCSWIWPSNVGADRCGRGWEWSCRSCDHGGFAWNALLSLKSMGSSTLQPYRILNVLDSFLAWHFARRSMMKLRCGCCISTWTHFHKQRRWGLRSSQSQGNSKPKIAKTPPKRLSISEGSNACVVCSEIHFSRGRPKLKADIVFVTGSPLERATRWAGGLNQPTSGAKKFTVKNYAIHWFAL